MNILDPQGPIGAAEKTIPIDSMMPMDRIMQMQRQQGASLPIGLKKAVHGPID
jgi:hypothetical protein